MTNTISGDNFPAHQAMKEQKLDAGATDKHLQDAPGLRTEAPGARTDVDRAHQRLSQETGAVRDPAIQSTDEARQKIAGLKALLAADPQTGLSAHRHVDGNLFEAAMARPTA